MMTKLRYNLWSTTKLVTYARRISPVIRCMHPPALPLFCWSEITLSVTENTDYMHGASLTTPSALCLRSDLTKELPPGLTKTY